jgi:hypothetical protein
MGFRRSRKASAFGNIVLKLLRTYGKLLVGGNVIFMWKMDGKFILILSPTEIRLLAKPIWLE